jgi:hypothetical protein
VSHLDPDLKYKRLDPENWLERDPALDHFVQFGVLGPRPITTQEWAEKFLSVELERDVPVDVRRLFAVARAIMLYGAFFYPLYGVAEERLFIVADAALLHRYEAEGGTRRSNGRWPTFDSRIKWLSSNGHLSPQQLEQWGTIRELRNLAAHPAAQTVFPPGTAFGMLRNVARDINELFVSVTE